MSSISLSVSGKNSLSIKLAHARATTMVFQHVSAINHRTFSFDICHDFEKSQQDLEQRFIQWCERLTKIKDNHITITVDSAVMS